MSDSEKEQWLRNATANLHYHILTKITEKAIQILDDDVNDCAVIRYEISEGHVINVRVQREIADGKVLGLPSKNIELKRGIAKPDTTMSEAEKARLTRWRG